MYALTLFPGWGYFLIAVRTPDGASRKGICRIGVSPRMPEFMLAGWSCGAAVRYHGSGDADPARQIPRVRVISWWPDDRS